VDNLGICCLLPFGALLFGVFFLAWSAVVRRVGPRHLWLWIGMSVPTFFAVLVLCVAAVLIYQALPAVIFRSSFGFSPTPDVKILHSCRAQPAHIESTYLEFYADESTIERVLKNGFAPISAQDIIECFNIPDWWTPNTGRGARIYATGTTDPEYRGDFRYFFSHQLLIYDPTSKKAYYRDRRR
jgi:hypothetical protein